MILNANLNDSCTIHVYISPPTMKTFEKSFDGIIRYNVYQKISSGTFGYVYKTNNNLNTKTVAMKVTDLKLETNGNEVTNILNLIKDKKYVKYVPEFYHVFYNEDAYCIVMEYLDGSHFDNKYFKQNISTIWQARKLCKKVLKAVDYFHTNKYVLNDLKWDNIIIDSKGNPKIIDFGLMHHMNHDHNCIKGAVLFLPPESYQHINSRGKKDIWSFGIMVYQFFIGGDCPFDNLISSNDSPNAINKYDFDINNLQSTIDNMKLTFITKMTHTFGNGKITSKYIQKMWDMIADCLTIKYYYRPTAKQLIKKYL